MRSVKSAVLSLDIVRAGDRQIDPHASTVFALTPQPGRRDWSASGIPRPSVAKRFGTARLEKDGTRVHSLAISENTFPRF